MVYNIIRFLGRRAIARLPSCNAIIYYNNFSLFSVWHGIHTHETTDLMEKLKPKQIHQALITKAENSRKRLKVLETKISSGQNYGEDDSKKYASLMALDGVYNEYLEQKENYNGLIGLLKDDDEIYLKEEAENELKTVIPAYNKAMDKLKAKLLKPHPFADRACILELRPGAGGHEADIFTEDILNMYTRYCQLHHWPYEILSRTEHDSGNGILEATLAVNHKGSYDRLRHEAGVHRVQRIPQTETKGRIQTSAAGVVVLPQIENMKSDNYVRKFEPGEVRIDVMRAGGAGGQHVNKTESAVRLTHIPTGIVVRIQDDRSQHRNKEKAFEVLRARLAEKEMRERNEREEKERMGQVSSVDRSDKIRTYNFQQNRVTDHRCNFTLYDLEGCMNGIRLDDIIDEVSKKEVDERAEALAMAIKDD